MLNRESLVGYKPTVCPISIPEWGGDAYIKIFSGKCRAKLDDFIMGITGDMTVEMSLTMMSKTIIYALCDADGNELLTETDLAVIESKPIDTVIRVFQEVAKLNGLQVTSKEIDTQKKT